MDDSSDSGGRGEDTLEEINDEDITPTREDYLRVIYELQHQESPVRTTTLAAALGVRPASATGTVKRLAELDLVNYKPYRGFTLTEAGEQIALEVIHHRRLIELFLIEVLGYSPHEVHEDAQLLAHVVSNRLEERIAELLGAPKVDLLGLSIPPRDDLDPSASGQPLSKLSAGDEGRVCWIENGNPELVRYLAERGIVLDTHLHIIESVPVAGYMNIRVGDQVYTLGREAAEQIYIELSD